MKLSISLAGTILAVSLAGCVHVPERIQIDCPPEEDGEHYEQIRYDCGSEGEAPDAPEAASPPAREEPEVEDEDPECIGCSPYDKDYPNGKPS